MFPLVSVFSDGSSSAVSLSPVEVSSSPLFKSLPNVIKRKGVRSTAVQPTSTPPEKSVHKCRDPEVQRCHNQRTLSLLNTGSLKELQDLQTVGTKRAKLIFDYRGINGDFQQVRHDKIHKEAYA